MLTSKHSRQGFTRVELLVVLALIALLILLCSPALFRSRVDSWRIWCSNNLKQVSLATMNYHDTYGVFPQGTRPSPDLSPEKRLSWLVSILPFLEQGNLWSSMDKEQAWYSAWNKQLAATQLRLFTCPPNSRPSKSITVGTTNYIGMAGVGADAAMLPLEDKKAGLFGYDRQVRIKDVKDGLSSTILALETTSDLGPWAAGGPSTVRSLDPERRPYLAADGLFGVKHKERTFFRSSPVGSNTAFADGSVRWVLASISSETLEALATIAGNDKPGDDFSDP